jgi:hypothetical protein
LKLNGKVPPAEEITPEVAADLERIYAIEARWQRMVDDPLLNIFDIAGLENCVETFKVSPTMAYLRAKGMGLLTWQRVKTESI